MARIELTLEEAKLLEYQYLGGKKNFEQVVAALGQGGLEEEKQLRVLIAHLNNPKSKINIITPKPTKEGMALLSTVEHLQQEDHVSSLSEEQVAHREETSRVNAIDNNEEFFEEKGFTITLSAHALEMSKWLSEKRIVHEVHESKVKKNFAFTVYNISESEMQKIEKKYNAILRTDKVVHGGKVAAEVTGTVTKGAVAATGKVLGAAVNVTTSTVVQTGKSLLEIAGSGTAKAVDEYQHQAARLASDEEVQRAKLMVKNGYNSLLSKFKKKGGKGGLNWK